MLQWRVVGVLHASHIKLTFRPLATFAILCCTSCSCETRALALTASTFISVSVMLVPINTLAGWRAAEFGVWGKSY